jgi:hypothetical protein
LTTVKIPCATIKRHLAVEPEKAVLEEISQGTGCTPTLKIIRAKAFDFFTTMPAGRPE